MAHYPITFERTDFRWLDQDGSERDKQKKGDYIFKSVITDSAEKMLKDECFLGSYIRALSTYHHETEQIALGILSIAEYCGGIVGVTLEGLVTDKVAREIIRYPSGKILYELLITDKGKNFNVSAGRGITIPDFSDYDGTINFMVGIKVDDNNNRPKAAKGRIKVKRKYAISDGELDHQVEKIKREVYIELKPEFVQKLVSTDIRLGTLKMSQYRKIAQKEKEKRRRAV